jgi:hypothetical protein
MRPTERPIGVSAERLAAAGEGATDVPGLVMQREQAARALDQTRQARRSGEIEQAGPRTAQELEQAVAGPPDPGPPGFVTARVVASPDARSKRPAVPLSGLTVRLTIGRRVPTKPKEKERPPAEGDEGALAEGTTNAFGLVALELPKPNQGAYALEVLGPDYTLLTSEAGRWSAKQPSPIHLVELARAASLKPHLERARPLEEGIIEARARADMAREVAAKALEVQEKRLVEYLGEIDAALAGAAYPLTAKRPTP